MSEGRAKFVVRDEEQALSTGQLYIRFCWLIVPGETKTMLPLTHLGVVLPYYALTTGYAERLVSTNARYCSIEQL